MLTLPALSKFQEIIIQNIHNDGFGELSVQGGRMDLKLNNNEVYEIDIERLRTLDAPRMFSGYLSISMTGIPTQANCRFSMKFADDKGHDLFGLKPDGCLLRINQFTVYLLPKAMFDLVEWVKQANQPDADEGQRWRVIEHAKNAVKEEHIHFQGLPNTEEIRNTPHVSIDLLLQSDGSIQVKPHFGSISDATQVNYADKLSEDNRAILVMNELRDVGGKKHIVRSITEKEVIKAYQRLEKIKHVSANNALKFLQNPTAFILQDDEVETDLAIQFRSYRILGVGEPYVGYFGSVRLDSPIARALAQNENLEIIQQIKDKVIAEVQGKDRAEIQTMLDNVNEAINTHKSECSISADVNLLPVEYDAAKDVLESIIRRTKGGGLNTKVVIKIDPNDENGFQVDVDVRKPLQEIHVNNTDKGTLFTDIQFEPKTYQVEGVNWLRDLYESGYHGGILADDMGLGKTYQIVVFLNYLLRQSKYKGDDGKRVLIVAPTILLDNWDGEIKKFIQPQFLDDKFRVKILRGRDLSYRNLKRKLDSGKQYNSFDVQNLLLVEDAPNIILTSYETLSNYQFAFADTAFNFDCIIYDEAHKIKNPNASISQAARAISSLVNFSVLLTGTPIENELRDLWALFDVFDPAHLGSWKHFKKEFIAGKQVEVDTRLRARASHYILRRLKKDYLRELPQKIEQTHEITLSNDEANHYLTIKNQGKPALERLHALRTFSLHPALLADGQQNIDLHNFTKTAKLLKLLDEIKEGNEKAIIFVINRSAQDLLRHGIEKHFEIKVPIINGENNQPVYVQKTLKNFAQIEGFAVMILSTLAAGVGLTITEANHVIHYERWWNASKEDQASDRAYRIGQEKNVYVHHIISTLAQIHGTDSLDQAIHELISQKRATAGFLTPPKNIQTQEIIDKLMNSTLNERVMAMDRKEFEELIKHIYQAQECTFEHTDDDGRDFGADIIGRNKRGELFAIACNHTSDNTIVPNQNRIYQLNDDAREHYKTNFLIAVTNANCFTPGAIVAAKRYDVKLIAWDELNELIQSYAPDLGVRL